MPENKARSDYAMQIETARLREPSGDQSVEVVLIVDKGLGRRSVSNDLDNVLHDVSLELPRWLRSYAVMYRDSMGRWDEIRLTKTSKPYLYRIVPLPRYDELEEIVEPAAARWLKRQA